MAGVSSPVCFIDYTGSSPTDYTGFDISNIITSVNFLYGRNQPFTLAEIVVPKAVFNSDEYWVQFTNPVYAVRPTIINGTTKIFISAYGESYNLVIEKSESQNDYITFLCYNNAYKLKSTKFDAFSTFQYDGTRFAFSFDNISSPTYNLTHTSLGNNRFRITVPISSACDFIVEAIIPQGESAYKVYTEQAYGTGAQFMRYLSFFAGYTDSSKILIEDGRAYVNPSSVTDSYTGGQLATFKNSGPSISYEPVMRFRTDINCWDMLQTIGLLTCRYAFFHDRAYFVNYMFSSSSSSSPYQHYHYMHIDYGGSYLQRYSTDPDSSYIPLNINHIADNADQGSQYVLSSQTVYGENYSVTSTVKDDSSKRVGGAIYYPYPESNAESMGAINNTERNTQTKMLALNRLVMFYRPSDCIAFTLSEIAQDTSGGGVTYIGNDIADIPAPRNPTEAQEIVQIYKNRVTTYYRNTATGWEAFDAYATLAERKALFAPYSKINIVFDRQNGLRIDNVPLSCVQLSWPSCVTTVWWGEPMFMDSQEQLSHLLKVTDSSTIIGTDDVNISDKYAAKIVVGNQALSELRDDRSNFSGLIMEKNWDKDIYRLTGYDNGRVQAYFNSKGQLMAGGGTVSLDEDGLKTIIGGRVTSHLTPGGTFNTGYINDNPYVYLDGTGLNIVQYSGFNQAAAMNFRQSYGSGSMMGNIYFDSTINRMVIRSYGSSGLELRSNAESSSSVTYFGISGYVSSTYTCSLTVTGGSISSLYSPNSTTVTFYHPPGNMVYYLTLGSDTYISSTALPTSYNSLELQIDCSRASSAAGCGIDVYIYTNIGNMWRKIDLRNTTSKSISIPLSAGSQIYGIRFYGEGNCTFSINRIRIMGVSGSSGQASILISSSATKPVTINGNTHVNGSFSVANLTELKNTNIAGTLGVMGLTTSSLGFTEGGNIVPNVSGRNKYTYPSTGTSYFIKLKIANAKYLIIRWGYTSTLTIGSTMQDKYISFTGEAFPDIPTILISYELFNTTVTPIRAGIAMNTYSHSETGFGISYETRYDGRAGTGRIHWIAYYMDP